MFVFAPQHKALLVQDTKNLVQQRHHKLTKLWFCARPWSGHVKNLDRVFLHEDPELVGSFRNSGMKMQPRLFMLPRKLHRFLRPAAQGRFNRKQNRSVTITHIPFGPLNVCSRSRFFQRILRVNRPIFGLPTVWAPSPAFDVVRQRPIQGGPVPSRFARRKQF